MKTYLLKCAVVTAVLALGVASARRQPCQLQQLSEPDRLPPNRHVGRGHGPGAACGRASALPVALLTRPGASTRNTAASPYALGT